MNDDVNLLTDTADAAEAAVVVAARLAAVQRARGGQDADAAQPVAGGARLEVGQQAVEVRVADEREHAARQWPEVVQVGVAVGEAVVEQAAEDAQLSR